MPRFFTARYDGTCDGCGADFEAGDDIMSDDGEGGWLGECCGGEDLHDF